MGYDDDWKWPKFMHEASKRTYERGRQFSDGTGYPNRACEVCAGSGLYKGAYGEPSDCGCTSISERGGEFSECETGGE